MLRRTWAGACQSWGNRKRSTLPGRFQGESLSDDLVWVHLGKFWQYNPRHFMLYMSESWQEGKPCSLCVCLQQFQKSSGQLKLGLTAFGPLTKSAWEVWGRDVTHGCAPSSPLRAPTCTVAHMLHPDCTEMDVLGRGDQQSSSGTASAWTQQVAGVPLPAPTLAISDSVISDFEH